MDASPATTPHTTPRRSRLSRLALTTTLALLALTLAGWVFSHARIITTGRRFGSIIAPGGPGGEPNEWTFRARTIRLAQFPGELSLGLSEYRSLAPKREGLDTWEDWRGWSADVIPASALTRDNQPAIHWRSASDFAFLGLGTTEFSRSGETTRIVSIPHWFLLTILATIAAALWFPAHRRARRIRHNQCPHCAYDRSATPPHAPCPECGRTRP